MTRRLLALMAAVTLAAGLAGCGKVGQLERPGPLFGNKASAETAPLPKQDPNRPIETVDPRDRSTDSAGPAPNPR